MPGLALVVGADSRIGAALLLRLAALGTPALGTTRRRATLSDQRLYLDLADATGWRPPPGVAVGFLCAGAVSLHDCRRDPAGTRRVNVEGLGTVAQALLGQGAFVVFASTNLVYDGRVPLRRAADPVCPVTEYGRQKAELERLLLSAGGFAAVVRLGKVLTAEDPLLHGWAAALRQGDPIHPFADLRVGPVTLEHACAALLRVAEWRAAGITQISACDELTYAELGCRLADRLGADPALVQPIAARDSGLDLEAVPAHASLDTTRLREELGLPTPTTSATLAAVLAAFSPAAQGAP